MAKPTKAEQARAAFEKRQVPMPFLKRALRSSPPPRREPAEGEAPEPWVWVSK